MTDPLRGQPVALVRGVGDVGSAIAWTLFQAGYVVIAHETRQPRTIRRKMAFCDALWTGEALLEEVSAVRIDRLEEVRRRATDDRVIALYTGSFDALVEAVRPDVIVDGRIQKFSTIQPLKERASVTIGVGPSFVAGEDVDAVIESCWGDELGRVILDGQAIEPVPVPPRLNGVGWERFVRSDRAGRFESDLSIGAYVEKGDQIGRLDDHPVCAAISGYVRGLLYPGLSVLKGEKLCEIDPRENEAHFVGLAERPKGIAQGVLNALDGFLSNDALQKDVKVLKDQDDHVILTNIVKIS
ncbi:hypothetical protein [Terasakiella pusilla]|uniref:hypothetical protein n=1 Tax=Terasakiella pusilla TaxID=64973 RepID=UPI003AA95CD9